jgi:chromosome segregation ATPase
VDLKLRRADTLAPTEEEFVMAMAARKIEAEFPMQEPTVLEKKVDRVQEDVAAVKADVKVLQSDVAVIKEDVKVLQSDVAVLKADVKVLQSDVNHLQEDVTDLKTDMKRIDAKVDAVGANLTEHRIATERSFAKVREEMKDGFAALKESFEKSGDRRFTLVACIVGTVVTTIGTTVAILKFVVAA